ncbi:relaxase domain-containing protein, partial [Rhizobium brockwellii]|uniref:relaxase domain-containing protein n=1 Tax=Rhizobium brockwellii TaxID=3019932 RepID=UPI003F98AF60
EVTKDAFESILNGVLPSGEAVAQVDNRRAGVDLTFSAPKSVSVLAYITGDKRILGENGATMKAAARAMGWIESNLAEGRKDVEGRKVPV